MCIFTLLTDLMWNTYSCSLRNVDKSPVYWKIRHFIVYKQRQTAHKFCWITRERSPVPQKYPDLLNITFPLNCICTPLNNTLPLSIPMHKALFTNKCGFIVSLFPVTSFKLKSSGSEQVCMCDVQITVHKLTFTLVRSMSSATAQKTWPFELPLVYPLSGLLTGKELVVFWAGVTEQVVLLCM